MNGESSSPLNSPGLEHFNLTPFLNVMGDWQVERDGDGGDVAVEEMPPLNMPYTIFEILVALVAVVGNAMVIYVFRVERKLRRRTNYYIVSLAIADLFVGLFGIPFAILAAIGLPTNLHACLFTISLLVVLCTISIFCLVAVSLDRYWAILHPMAYSRNVRTRTAIVIIAACWFAGIFIGFLPLFGWHAPQNGPTVCLFVKVMSYDYLVFLYFGTIVTPAILLIAFYAHIYRVIIRQLRQIVTMNPTGTATTTTTPNNCPANPPPLNANSNAPPPLGLPSANSTSTNIITGLVQQLSRRSSKRSNNSGPNTPEVSPRTQSPFSYGSQGGDRGGGTMLRVFGAAQKREVKATQNLSIIVLFFMICWLPLYTVNCVNAFCQDCQIDSKLMLALIALSHVNSAVNPLLYAYHLRDFRAALKNLILRMMGREVPRTTIDAQRRISAASRIQSMREQKRSFHPRIYIDSPVWLRQQQAQGGGGGGGGGKIEGSNGLTMSAALRSVVRVASTPTDAATPEIMSQIVEVPSHAERESSKNLTEGSFGKLDRAVTGNFSKKSSQSSNLGKRGSNKGSFDWEGEREEEEEEEDVGIRIVIRKKGGDENNNNVINCVNNDVKEGERKRKRKRKKKGGKSGKEEISSESENEGDFNVSSSCSSNSSSSSSSSSPEENLSISFIYGDENLNLNSNLRENLPDLLPHSTDLPTFHENQNHRKLDERSFYDAFKRRGKRKGKRRRMRRESFEENNQKKMIQRTEETLSSTGTISSEDLTEFNDQSASSVFIIENDTIQLSPKREEDGNGTSARSSGRKNVQQRTRRSSSKDILKHSPLKVVTQLIFSGGSAGNGGSVSCGEGATGRFNYVDIEEEKIKSNDS